ncbi:MAG: chorismate mutase [Chloroflexi bacterium]|nr:chorismate mutase [Chloroflexota bacterium]
MQGGDGARSKVTIDLSELRVRLDQMTERIVSRLKDRSRFALNQAVYTPGAIEIAGRSGSSFLEFSIEGLEAYHASLGRFDYPDQHPVSGANLPSSPVRRVRSEAGIEPRSISIRDNLLSFYLSVLPALCRPGDEPQNYGETVYVDADLLQLLNERINVGRFVAEAKLRNDPTVGPARHDAALLSAALRDSKREEALIGVVRATAARYELDSDIVERIFRWIIEETLRVEVVYLQG